MRLLLAEQLAPPELSRFLHKTNMEMKPKIKIKFILIAVVVLTLAFPLTASAQTITGEMSSVFNNILGGLAEFLTVLLKVLQRILWPIFLAIGGLLNNDILFGYGMEERLLQVWVQIRNYVNIIFVVILLGVALFNVLAINPDNDYAIKKFLPKFAIALIAVNFSYIAMKIVLDVTNVATTAIFTLPSSISKEVANPQIVDCPETGPCAVKNTETVEKICKAYYGTPAEWEKSIAEMSPKDLEAVKPGLICEVTGGKFTLSATGTDFFRRYNARNAGLIMAIQFMNVMDVDKVSSNISKDKIDISGLAFNLLFSVILYIVYGAAYLALFVVLLTRLVVLWLFIALSPVVALTLAVPNLVPQAGGDVQKKFFKNAFAPILMGIPLTIGYVILEAFRASKTNTDVGLGTAFNMVKLEASGISDLQSLIIAFAAVAVVWVGVFAAASETFAARFTEKIKQGVEGLGRTAISGLKMLPIIPAGPGGKGLSFYQAQEVAGSRWRELEKTYGRGSLAGTKSMTKTEIESVMRNAKSTPKEGREAVLAGLAGGTLEKTAAYNLLKKWESAPGGGEKQRFAKGVLSELTQSEREAFAKGKVEGGTLTKLRGSRFLREETGAGAGAGTRPTLPAGAGPAAATGAGTVATGTGQNADVNTVVSAQNSGLAVSDDLSATKEKWLRAKISNDAKGMQEAETDLKGKHKDEIAVLQSASKSSAQIEAVQTSAGSVNTEKPEKKTVDDLKNALAKADQALDKNGVKNKDKRKEILGQILQKATGNKAAALVSSDAGKDLGRYVKVS